MWNNAEHLIAYFAVPSMGAVLHALNIRLFPQQLVYITARGQRGVIVDNTLAAPFSQLLPAHDAASRHRRPGREAMRELSPHRSIESFHDFYEPSTGAGDL